MYSGKSIQMRLRSEGFVELCFDRTDAQVNRFDTRTVAELRDAMALVATASGVRGLLVTSAKDAFIVGTDINEFDEKFRLPHSELVADVRHSNEVLLALEDLSVPSVVAIGGLASGSGLECALACALRAMSHDARIGLPGVKLGLIPGFGGTVRLARIAGTQVAMAWVTDGQTRSAERALAAEVVDAVFDPLALRDGAFMLLRRAAAGQIDWRAAQERKRSPVRANTSGRTEAFAPWRERPAADMSAYRPAAPAAITLLARSAPLERDAALALEAETFARISQTQAAGALVRAFLGKRSMRQKAEYLARDARPPRRAAWIGETRAAFEAMAAAAGAAVDHAQEDPSDADIVLVVRSADPSGAVAVLESKARDDAVIAVDPSGHSMEALARTLRRPERLIGWRFSHPVAATNLVELVRGPTTSDGTLATAMAYALALGKLPLVVRDTPGLLIDRLTTVLKTAAQAVAHQCADPDALRAALQRFEWSTVPLSLGPGSSSGRADSLVMGPDLSDTQIIDRLMLPLVIEATRALDEGVVSTAAELDLALMLAGSCPAHTGGPLQWADWTGLAEIVRRCDALRAHGPMYTVPPRLRVLASENATFHSI